RRRHTRSKRDWSSDVCSSDLEDYKELLHTDTADINNMCNTPLGGSIAAALFLQQFAKDTDKWIHIDMANKMTPQKVHSYYTPGASGFGVRLLYALVLEE